MCVCVCECVCVCVRERERERERERDRHLLFLLTMDYLTIFTHLLDTSVQILDICRGASTIVYMYMCAYVQCVFE